MMVVGVWSEDPQQQLESTTQFRKLLSIGPPRPAFLVTPLLPPAPGAGTPDRLFRAERNPPIDEVIAQGVIPRFVQFLQRSDLSQLQVRPACPSPCMRRPVLRSSWPMMCSRRLWGHSLRRRGP